MGIQMCALCNKFYLFGLKIIEQINNDVIYKVG